MDRPLIDSVCTTCGSCLASCPTGAITAKADIPAPVRTVTTTCPYCGVGCGIKARIDPNDRIIEMLDDPDNQSSLGMLCVKGRFGFSFVNHPDRLTKPMVRKNGELTPVEWDEAIEYVADRLSEYRGDSFGTLASAKATNEGRLHPAEVRPTHHAEQSHRPLHAALPRPLCGSDAGRPRKWRDLQLVH